MNMREEITTPPRSARLPFQIRMSGISYCDGTYVIRRTASPITCMEYVIEGKGSVTENDETFTAQAGDIYLLHEGKDHYYFSDAQEPWTKIWMNLTGTTVEHLIYAYGLDRINHVRGLNLSEEFHRFYDTARTCVTAEEAADRCALIFHEILQKIADYLRTQTAEESSTARTIKGLIDAAPAYNITLEELSGQLYFSKTHLIRVFRAEYKVTPYEYILSRKLRLAKDLLTNTSLSVGEISAYLNFCDAHYFSNFFRERTGTTPREYRKGKKS